MKMSNAMRGLTTVAGACAIAVLVAGCSNDPTVNPNGSSTNGSNLVFQQIDRIGRPGVKELFLKYSAHDAFDRANPQNDWKDTAPQIDSFMRGTAGRSEAVSQYVQALLMPDVLIANVADMSPHASYLGWETKAGIAVDCKGASPTTFGGRSLTDDVVSAMLGLAFGNTATTVAAPNVPNYAGTALGLSPAPEDGKEQNGQNGRPQLANQNLTCGNKGFTLATFPYLGAPI